MTSLPQREIKRLIATLRQLEFSPNTILFREGDHGDRFYIILEGQLEIIKALGTPEEQLLNICGPGDYVGEMCLLDPDRSRTASVRTGSSVKLLEMTRADLDALLHQYPAIGYAMARVLSQRLYASETKMSAELNRKNRQLSQAYSHLQSLLPQLKQKEGTEKQKKVGHFKLPSDFDLQDITVPGDCKAPKSLKKDWEVRQAIYRSGLCQINVETLGGFRINRGLTVMEEKEWDGYLPKLLLKAIVTHGSRRVPKDQLIETLWPEVAPQSGERNFKITLYRLRKALEPEMDKAFGSSYVHLKANLIYLDEELCKTDIDDFLSLYRRGEKNEREGNIESALFLYNNAIDLYKGDFLSEELYTSWIDIKREELRKLYINLLYKMADIQEKRGTSKVALDCYKKIIQIDPLSEQVYQRLMTLYSNRRMRTEAIKVYEDCRRALLEGLDAEPEALTTSIYRKIMETG
ncbi:MAG TPA: BTAD domain-containing putative transcriptional regulator [Syntrophales bacterium]|nr:BTAD domain-containing putative transcriptional regulator [Syntrophales bacterium]